MSLGLSASNDATWFPGETFQVMTVLSWSVTDLPFAAVGQTQNCRFIRLSIGNSVPRAT